MDAPFDFWTFDLIPQNNKNTTRIGEKCKNCRSFLHQNSTIKLVTSGTTR